MPYRLKRPCKVSTCRNLTARGTYGPNIAMSQVDLNLSACDSDASIRQRILVRISGGPQANDELASASELPLPGAAGSPRTPGVCSTTADKREVTCGSSISRASCTAGPTLPLCDMLACNRAVTCRVRSAESAGNTESWR